MGDPADIVATVAMAVALVAVKAAPKVVEVTLKAMRVSADDWDEELRRRCLRVLFTLVRALSCFDQAGRDFSKAQSAFLADSRTDHLRAAAIKYRASMEEGKAEARLAGDALIGRLKMNELLRGLEKHEDFSKWMARLKAGGIFVTGLGVMGLSAWLVVDLCTAGGAFTLTMITLALGSALLPLGTVAGGALMALGPHIYAVEKRSILASTVEAKKKCDEVWDVIIVTKEAIFEVHAAFERLITFGEDIAQAASQGAQAAREALGMPLQALVLNGAEATQLANLASTDLVLEAKTPITEDDIRDAAAGRALYNPRCVIPKDRPEPGWPGWVTVLNRTGGPITVLVTFQGKKNPAMEREIGPDEEYVRKCQLVWMKVRLSRDGQQVLEQTVYGKSDWVAIESPKSFALVDRRVLQRFL